MTPDEAFDTPAWRVERDRRLSEWVGDPHALEFLAIFGNAAEFFDDVIDKDKPISDAVTISVMYGVMVDLHSNPFFCRYKSELVPLMSATINAWLDSNTLQKRDDVGKSRAYVLRDLPIEVTLHVIGICRGRAYLRSVSVAVRDFFLHETLEEYRGK